ncbi:bifunctional glutamate N-acetyltransferase/amino-acid acetyltransferase ArgJ [Umboniibacter marinipuniceus]|uniref:Arginine biosynthesis bifunctional protein ArgJ n=1 Tax=Umboniibacter marinipuniceus TaxID=569599 RepID=A0A3M0AF92_9GAMM|nr:bifunctional glutamate N-acetyltransferase/amino-acid acetyltransferase ArgJ [Umboniibacter marinipuniceus]RMA81428.1 glutamate N-acetyltransferase [Umboniibacter marinipuniceus]
MPVGNTQDGPELAVDGLEIAVIEAGIRYPDRKDLVLFRLEAGTTVSGLFTKNRFCAAPVHVAKANLSTGNIRALVINTGNANAGTGSQGMGDAQLSCELVAAQLGYSADQVLPYSTGVIGETMPMERFAAGVQQITTESFGASWLQAATGIMTTDTVPKYAGRTLAIAGGEITIAGISKGAGMIKPNMATMLGFVATDARIAQTHLDELASSLIEPSFNRITVDGDTSTNDAAMLIATGASGVELAPGQPGWHEFKQQLGEVFLFLAQAIVRDAEGATKFVTVEVTSTQTSDEARLVAYAVAESPLVKTALYASDPNWGRILAAVGRAGISDLDTEQVSIYLNELEIVRNGAVSPDYTEEAGQAVMDLSEITISISLGRGDNSDTVYTCDFSHDYVSINADYRS